MIVDYPAGKLSWQHLCSRCYFVILYDGFTSCIREDVTCAVFANNLYLGFLYSSAVILHCNCIVYGSAF